MNIIEPMMDGPVNKMGLGFDSRQSNGLKCVLVSTAAAERKSALFLKASVEGFETFPSDAPCSAPPANQTIFFYQNHKTISVTLSMAPKRPPPVEDPPCFYLRRGGGGRIFQHKTNPNPPLKITETTTQQSESDTDSESESESDQIVTYTSKPMDQTPPKAASAASKKSRSKPATLEKTRRNGLRNKESEKPEDSKKQLFQRLWTEDDEIALLLGIIDFTEKKGYDPSKDMNAFYDFIKKSLHFDVSMTQLKDKISRLKKKFENHVKGKTGENKTFSKPHDQKGFDLSKSIWAAKGVLKLMGRNESGNTLNNNNKTGNGKQLEASNPELGMDVREEDRVEVEMGRGSSVKSVLKFDSSVSAGRMEDYIVRMGLNFVHGTEKEKMEEEWRKLHVAELELFLKRNELIREQANLMLASFKTEKD
uniref:Glabrous enhancer-binding protein-like DBD domain-containing protein n=1 Tax=Salix viminalis TaxID=40686 RepID=A0A6N2NIJ5_SALVM